MIKKLKAPPVNLRRALLRATTPELMRTIERIGPGIVDELLDIFNDIEGWDEQVALPDRAMRTLFVLGATEEVTEAWTDLVFELVGDGVDPVTHEEFALGRLCVVLGDHAAPALAGPVLLDALDDCLSPSGVADCGWIHVLEPLCDFGARGWHDERTWSWLERLRREDTDQWCTYVDGYGDLRVIPLLHDVVDGCSDEDRMIIEAFAALESYDALRPTDLERRDRVKAIYEARAAKP